MCARKWIRFTYKRPVRRYDTIALGLLKKSRSTYVNGVIIAMLYIHLIRIKNNNNNRPPPPLYWYFLKRQETRYQGMMALSRRIRINPLPLRHTACSLCQTTSDPDRSQSTSVGSFVPDRSSFYVQFMCACALHQV